MKTVVRSQTREVTISNDGPITMIGERINPTGRKVLAAALLEGDLDHVRKLAAQQAAVGADILDINIGVPGMDEAAVMPDVVEAISAEVDLPLCIDTANPDALTAALSVVSGKVLVNSVNGEEQSLATVLPMVKQSGAAVIGLTMDEQGIPADAETRAAIAERIVERATGLGIPIEDVVIDPLVLTIGADPDAARVTLDAIELITNRLGVNISLGASNVSFGMPERHILNQAFLSLAIRAGATCVMTHVARLGLTIRATEVLLGRDQHASRYIKMFRAQQPKE
jgi:5-methyltetrahydrofolate--homocysteine methyltransferase